MGKLMKKRFILSPLLIFFVFLVGYEIYTSYKGRELLVAAHLVEGLSLAAPIKMRVVEFYNMQGEFPDSNAELGLPSPSSLYGRSVKSIEVSMGGKVTITYKNALKKDSSIILTPAIPGGYSLQAIEWVCTTETIEQSLFENISVPCFYSPPGPLNDLMNAIIAVDEVKVHTAIRNGVDVNAVLHGDTPLLAAIGRGGYAITLQLITAGVNVNQGALAYRGITPLIHAAILGKDGVSILLLDHGADIDAVDDVGKTALMHAAEKGRKNIVELLLSRGANLSLVDNRGRDAAYYAKKRGRRVGIGKLIDEARLHGLAKSVQHEQVTGVSDLMRAAGQGDIAEARRLIGMGAPVGAVDGHNATALHYALESRHDLIAGMLIEAGIEVNTADRDGNTPLLLAVKSGVPEIVSILIQSGAKVNVKDRYHNSPFLLAIRYGHNDIVELLLRAGVDESINKALYASFLSPASAESVVVIQQLILNSKLEVEHDAEDLGLLLVAAIKAERISIVRFLLKRGVDLDADIDGLPLHIATQNGVYEIARLLVEHGANIDVVNREGKTALMLAVETGQSRLVKLLLDAGADIDVTDINGLSALRMAKANYSEDIVELLRQYKK